MLGSFLLQWFMDGPMEISHIGGNNDQTHFENALWSLGSLHGPIPFCWAILGPIIGRIAVHDA